MTIATWTKLKNGDWGLRISGGAPVRPGMTVVAVSRDGRKSDVAVSRVVWSGNGVTIAAVRGQGEGRSQGHEQHRRSGGWGRCEACGHSAHECADLDCACRTCGGMMR
jgi:hypothetical protein